MNRLLQYHDNFNSNRSLLLVRPTQTDNVRFIRIQKNKVDE